MIACGLTLRRLPWYASWQTGDDAIRCRRSSANELLEVIRSRHLDTQTLQELLDILQFELLCYALRKQEDEDDELEFLPASGSPVDSSPVVALGPLQPALFRPWTEDLVEELAGSLNRDINETSHRERELQSRALLHAMLLLRAQGVRVLHGEMYDALHKQLGQRFHELRWQSGSSGALSPGLFRKIDCSYVLCATAEFMNKFEQARSWQHVILARAGSLLAFGLSISSPAWSGANTTMQDAWDYLHAGLSEYSSSANDRHEELFYLQELAAVATALQMHAKITECNSNTRITAAMMSRLTKELSKVILNKTLSAIDEYFPLDNVMPPAKFWQDYQADSSAGPPELDMYYYLYGLMDCASQLARLAGPAQLPEIDDDSLQLLALQGQEPTLRWKAEEYLIESSGSYEAVKKQLTEAAEEKDRLLMESELSGLSNMSLSAVYPRTDLASNALQPNGTNLPKIMSSDWTEPMFESPTVSSDCETYSIFSSKNTKKWYASVGLSPDCYAAFLLETDSVAVYSTAPAKKNEHREPLFTQNKISSNLVACALSDRFLATISTDELQVTAYNLGGGKPTYALTPDSFEPAPDGTRWAPRSVAIFDAPERTWIAVAGQMGHSGSIRIYEINTSMDLATSSLRDEAFARPFPDPLKNDLVETVEFSGNGGRLVVTTRNNRVVIWFISNNLRPLQAPFVISKPYAVETDVRGITSATVFLSPSARCYVLCTTSPSSERELYGGEFSFISPVASSASKVSSRVEHALVELRNCKNILVGCASPAGDVVALLEDSGRIYFFPLEPHPKSHYGGLYGKKMVKIKKRLEDQEWASTMSMRFSVSRAGLEFYAIDNRGTIVHKLVESDPKVVRRHSLRPSATSGASVFSGTTTTSSQRSSNPSG